MIARTASGSLRDAENLLEQALVSYGSPLTETQVGDLLELGSDERALELAGHVVDRAAGEGIKVIKPGRRRRERPATVPPGAAGVPQGHPSAEVGRENNAGLPEETLDLMNAMAKRSTIDHVVRTLKTFSAVELRRDSSSPLPPRAGDGRVDAGAKSAGSRSRARGSSTRAANERRARLRSTGPVGSSDVEACASSPPGRAGANDERNRGSCRASLRPTAANKFSSAKRTLPTDPSGRLDALWDDIVKSLRTRKGKRFNLGALLRSSIERVVSDDTVTLKYAHASHQERMQEELDDPESRKVLQEALAEALEGSYQIQASMAEGRANGPRQKASQRSHLVRSAQTMGARIVDEKEEVLDDE